MLCRAPLITSAALLALTSEEAWAQVRPAAEAPAAQVAPPARVVPPKLSVEPHVPYPEGARGSASVVLVLVIGEDGKVREVSAEALQPPFSDAAVAAAYGFRFEPARRADTPLAAKIKMLITFQEPAAAEPLPPAPPQLAALPAESSATAVAAPPAKPAPLEVTVVGEEREPSRSVSLSRAEVRQIPGTFGDPFRAIEIMPGVTPIVSGLPFFFVRGAPPGNVGYFLDGVRVPLLFHVGVGPSVVHPALIERVDLYPGGYPARYGRFAGGVVAGETIGPERELHGEYNLRLFDAGALVETGFAEGRGTALLAGRYSYTAALLSYFSPTTTLDYWDYQARVNYDLSRADSLGVFAFGSHDFVGEKTETEDLTLFGTDFHRIDLRYDHRIDERGNLRTAFTLGLDQSIAQQDRSVRERLGGARTALDYRLSRALLLRAGTDVQANRFDVLLGTNDLSPSTARVAEFFPSRTDLAAGLHADAVVDVDKALRITPGARVDVFASEGAVAASVDPRLSLRARVTSKLQLLTALGIAHQPPAFVVPLPGFQPGGIRGGLQRAIQESFGAELDLGNATTASLTVFQNAFFQMSDPLGSIAPLPSGCPPGTFPADTLAGDYGRPLSGTPACGPRFRSGVLGPDRSGGFGQGADSRGAQRRASAFEVRTMGSAYGVEFFVKRRLTRKLGGFFAYTLSRSLRSYERRDYVATFDRTHVLNVALAYDLGRNWRAGTRAMFYTGLPKAPDPQSPGDTRLPAFFRLDLRLEKRWSLGSKGWISVVAEWMNATLSQEAVATTCTLAGCEPQMIGPITIPSLGMEGGF